ncbi:hypothetical protein ACJJTC_006676 [Scirpophaga incertulas]
MFFSVSRISISRHRNGSTSRISSGVVVEAFESNSRADCVRTRRRHSGVSQQLRNTKDVIEMSRKSRVLCDAGVAREVRVWVKVSGVVRLSLSTLCACVNGGVCSRDGSGDGAVMFVA